jgi:hypothetical protein
VSQFEFLLLNPRQIHTPDAKTTIIARKPPNAHFSTNWSHPTKVVRTALQDAASIAGLIVTTEATITEHPKKEAPAMRAEGQAEMKLALSGVLVA